MIVYVLALLIGVIAGMRTMTAPAAVSWAVAVGWLPLAESRIGLLGYGVVPYLLTALALAEYVGDALPSTPSRKMPPQFAIRIVSGAVCGAAIGTAGGATLAGLAAGAIGAVIGTLGGFAFRKRLAEAFGRDLPAAVIEDLTAAGGALLIVLALA